jgi:hypothetical protein
MATDWTRRLLATTVLGVLAVALPALADDSRCEKQPERPQCQSTDDTPEPTTTTSTEAPTTTSTEGTTTTTGPVPDPDPDPDPTTTTTAPGPDPEPTTTTTLPAAPPDAISVIGCSNTHHAASGYLDASEMDLLVNTAWAGHTVEYWALNDDGWVDHYLPLRPFDGFDGAWFNLCERASAGLTLENAETVLAKIWEIDPGIPVWVSPLNFYEGEECDVTNGNQIPNEGSIIADTLVANYEGVERGPDLGPLTAEHLRRDLCHPNRDGITFLGTQLQAFFDS